MRIVQTWAGLGGVPTGWERHCPVLWSKWEYEPGRYDYAYIDDLLARQSTPVHLQIIISMWGRETGLADYTPAFHQRTLRLTTSDGKLGAIPNYADASWQTAYQRAVAALATRYARHAQVVGYWHAVGVNQETQATLRSVDGADWHTPAARVLSETGYYDFIVNSTAAAVTAWDPMPVYLPGAASPGVTWGRKRRDVVQSALLAGARYQMCGLLADNTTAYGLGVRAGQGLTDIIAATGARCAFEGGKQAGADPWELYWLLMRAAHWQADFVDLQASWTPHYPTVAPFLPAADCRWLVWRDAEFSAQTWTGGDGQLYGQSGEPGCWARGLTWLTGGRLSLDAQRYDWGRWRLDAAEPVVVGAPGVPDGDYLVSVYYPSNDGDTLTVTVRGECFSLPSGAYHRVDLHTSSSPAAVKPTFSEALRTAAEAHDLLAIYEDAALCKAGVSKGLWPTSNEFDFTFEGQAYVAQRFRAPRSQRVWVLYCVRGVWDTVMELVY